MDKQEQKDREAKIIELAVSFCNEKLNDECAALCTKLIHKLGSEISKPLQSGRLEDWAAASVYAMCSCNLLFGNWSPLCLSSSDICEYFHTTKSTTAKNAKSIRKLLNISLWFDPDFTLKEFAERNPFKHFCKLDISHFFR